MERRRHPLIVNFPTILVYGLILIVGGYLLLTELTKSSPPESTISEFGARYLAKSAYSNMTSNTVPTAVCDAIRYRSDEDTWDIECRFEREEEGVREITIWEVAPTGEATLVDTITEEL